jgi:hypothetical protein
MELKTQLVYMTGNNKLVTKQEAFKIVNMIRAKCEENKDWIMIKNDHEHSISFLDQSAISLSDEFCFFTEFDENPLEVGAYRLAGMKNMGNVLTLGGRLDACSCTMTNDKYQKFVEEILAEMNKITKNKFNIHWV